MKKVLIVLSMFMAVVPAVYAYNTTIEHKNEITLLNALDIMDEIAAQGFKDINKASVITVLKLAEALNADVYDIINGRTEEEMIPK